MRLASRRCRDYAMNEAQFIDDRGREREWITVRHAEATVQAVEYISQRKPALHEVIERGFLDGRLVGERRLVRTLGNEHETAGHRSVEGINDMQVMRPCFSPVFPRVHSGVGADEVVFPLSRRTFLVIAIERGG